MRGLTLMATLAATLLASTAIAQTTGRIQGRVLDPGGDALPGVLVTATSPNQIQEKAIETDANGEFRFLNLPPGTYAVTATLDGFGSAQSEKIVVGIDRTASVELTLATEISATIQVTDEGAVVDVTSAEAGLSISREAFENLPTQRNFYAVAQLAPGVGEDTFGTTVSGSTSAENQYVIEGLNTTGVEVGIEGKQLNFDFIEEVEVKTGGLSAEYGRLTGGVINAVTKSGGNEISGGVFGYYSGGSLRADDKTVSERPTTTTQLIEVDSQQDYGFNLGGFLVKDRAWYFLAYDRVEQTNDETVIRPLSAPGSPAVGDVINSDIERDFYAGKMTWSLNANNTITGSVFGDPSERSGNVFPVAGPEITWSGLLETGSDDYVVRYDGVYGGSWILESVLGRHQETNFTSGPGKSRVQFIDQTTSPTVVSNGFGFHQDQEFTRDVAKLTVSKFLGSHELKAGGDLEALQASNANWNGGAGQRIYLFDDGAGGIYYRHRFYVDDSAPGFDRNDPATWQIRTPLVSEPETQNTSWFAQDSWRLADNLTVNAGLRFEQQRIEGRDGTTQIDIDDAWAPRLGLVWDVANNGRSKLYANFGRYYESVPMDINIRAFGGEVQCFCYNFSADPSDITPDDAAPRRSALLGGTTPVDPDLAGQYVDEYLLGFEYEVMPNLAIGVQASHRDLGRVIEDFLQPDGNYFIANPSEGIGTHVTFYDYYYPDYFPAGYDFTAPAPAAEREYTAVTLTARKRFSDNWQLIASYVWSELEGNYDGAFQVSTGQLDPNINSAYDYADFMVNANGKLSLDQTHTFKVDASYLFSDSILDGLNVGASAYYRSGFPLNAYGYSFAYANNELFLAPRGSVGRGPDDYEMDLALSYPISLGDSGVAVKLTLDAFNILDRQAKTRLDERYNMASDGFCGGIPDDLCSTMGGIDHVEGTTDPSGALTDPRASSPNPNYLDRAFNFTPARTIRLGLKINF